MPKKYIPTGLPAGNWAGRNWTFGLTKQYAGYSREDIAKMIREMRLKLMTVAEIADHFYPGYGEAGYSRIHEFLAGCPRHVRYLVGANDPIREPDFSVRLDRGRSA